MNGKLCPSLVPHLRKNTKISYDQNQWEFHFKTIKYVFIISSIHRKYHQIVYKLIWRFLSLHSTREVPKTRSCVIFFSLYFYESPNGSVSAPFLQKWHTTFSIFTFSSKVHSTICNIAFSRILQRKVNVSIFPCPNTDLRGLPVVTAHTHFGCHNGSFKHFQTVFKISQDFENYLWPVENEFVKKAEHLNKL